MGILQRAITLILRRESKVFQVKSLVLTHSACPCKNFLPKCSQTPRELIYRISLINRPGVYLLTEFFDPALNRGRRLMFMFFARAKPQLVLVDKIICINSRMASQGSVSEDRHEETSVIRGHHVYKSVWTPEVGEELSLVT